MTCPTDTAIYRYFVVVLNKTIFLLALVGYEMIIANSYPIGVPYLVKSKRHLFTEISKEVTCLYGHSKRPR